jgi:hypothetical protein
MSENLHRNGNLGPAGDADTEQEDIALAKILQQQERAFLELHGTSQADLRLPGDPSEEVPPPGMTEDEELAWRLMREEESMFQQRMMAMAGLVGPSSLLHEDPSVENLQEHQRHGTDGRATDDLEVDPDSLTYEELTTLGDMAGTVACGLTEEQLAKLTRGAHGKLATLNGDPCIVCQADFEAEDPVVQLPCLHVFHEECLRPWLSRKKCCPFCSAEVTQ